MNLEVVSVILVAIQKLKLRVSSRFKANSQEHHGSAMFVDTELAWN